MENSDDIFESCFNYFISNNFKQAYHAFFKNYYKHPGKIKFLYGTIISLILLDNIKELINFLEKEIKISPLSNKIKSIVNFIKMNDYFNNINKISILFNIGLFFKKRKLWEDAILFFKVCIILDPSNKKALTVLGEYALIKQNFTKGINLFKKAINKKLV